MVLNTTNSISDTIAAISTPHGTGGIAVIRISGSKTLPILAKIWKGKNPQDFKSHTAHLGKIINPSDQTEIDQAVATLFLAPNSFTGEDTAEISCHGSQYIQNQILLALISAGARIAEPGEFTKRAFLNARIDLAQADAIADLIAAKSKTAHDIALRHTNGQISKELNAINDKLLNLASLLELELDFSEEDVEFVDRKTLKTLADETLRQISTLTESYILGHAISQGINIVIAGAPNAGKSTLLNTLTRQEKAIVSEIPGTTRDTIDATTQIDGIEFRFIDTAGLRHTDDTIEAIGIQRANKAITDADITLWLIDPTEPLQPQISNISEYSDLLPKEELPAAPHQQNIIILLTKTDLLDETKINSTRQQINAPVIIPISSHTGEGIDSLRQQLIHTVTLGRDPRRQLLLTNARHYEALNKAQESLQRLIAGLDEGTTADFLAQDIRETMAHIGTITGTITTTDILTNIFSRFCIGK